MSRITVKRLTAHGFQQGTRAERNDGECATCGKRIQTVRSWWIGGGGEYDDNWQGCCRRHAEERMLKDEAMWGDDAVWADLIAATPEAINP